MFSYAGLVDMGVYEPHNDDRALLGTQLITEGCTAGQTDRPYFLAAVCDGVGGMKQGGRAAKLTVQALVPCCRAGLSADELREDIEQANTGLRDLQDEEGMPDGLRTVLAGLYADGTRLLVFNAGDSRVYRLRCGYVRQLSKDHSLVQDMLDLGEITPEQAKTHPQKNIVNKCLGNADIVNPRIKEWEDDLLAGDLLMICSDGICDVLAKEDIAGILAPHSKDGDLSEACRALRDAAVQNGSKDNMTVLLVRKEETA